MDCISHKSAAVAVEYGKEAKTYIYQNDQNFNGFFIMCTLLTPPFSIRRRPPRAWTPLLTKTDAAVAAWAGKMYCISSKNAAVAVEYGKEAKTYIYQIDGNKIVLYCNTYFLSFIFMNPRKYGLKMASWIGEIVMASPGSRYCACAGVTDETAIRRHPPCFLDHFKPYIKDFLSLMANILLK